MEGTVTVRLVEDTRHKAPRQLCFSLRKKIDSSPRAFKSYKILLGAYVISHILCAFLIFTLATEAKITEWALYPLFFLALQFQVLCTSMIGVIVSDIMNQALTMAVWQRSAIGRILRNTFISLMILLFFVLCLGYTEITSNQISVLSVTKISLPLDILIVMSIIKLMLIKGESSFIWLTLSFCALSEVVVLVIFNDFQIKIQALYLTLPAFIALFALSVKMVKELSMDLVKNLLGILICMTFATYLAIKVAVLDGWLKREFFYDFSAYIGFFLLYWNYSQTVGVFVLDIVFGYVETDYQYFINPPVRDGIRSCTT